MKTFTLLTALICFGFATSVCASAVAPCPPIDVKSKGNFIILPGKPNANNSTAYFLQNISNDAVIVDHPNTSGSASAGLASKLNPGHWSALQINKKNYELSCTTQQADKNTAIDCKKVLVVCVPPQLSLNSKEQGIFWLSEDKELTDFLQELSSKGIKY